MKARIKLAIYIAICVLTLASCVEEPAPPRKILPISIAGNESGFIFAGMPTSFGLDPDRYGSYPINTTLKWYFGDGSSGERFSIADRFWTSHTYAFPGKYRVALEWEAGRVNVQDTIINVVNGPIIIGGTETTENGILLHEDAGGNFRVVYKKRSGGDNEWRLLRTNENFDSLYSSKLGFYYSYDDVQLTIASGNRIAMLTENTLFEFDLNGNLQRAKQLTYHPLNPVLTKMGFVDGGYYVMGDTAQQTVVKYFDLSLNLKWNLYLDKISGMRMTHAQLIGPETIVSCFAEELNSKRSRLLIQSGNEVTVDKEFQVPSISHVFPLADGYLCSSVLYEEFSFETRAQWRKVNKLGEEEWVVTRRFAPLYSYYDTPPICVFEQESFIYIFYEDMKGIKLDHAGNTVWEKSFSLANDPFNHAVINRKGNFVLLGSRQFDRTKMEHTNDYEKRDLLLVEVAKNGDIVD